MGFKWVILIAIVGLLTISCDPKDCFDPSNNCSWHVRNETTDTLWCLTNFYINIPKVLPPKDSVLVYSIGVSDAEKTDDMFSLILNAVVIDEMFTILNSKNEELIVWKESQRNDPGRQFFHEKYWETKEWVDGEYIYYEWTFELLPEDIQQ